MTDESYYDLLGVEPGASRDELRAAYRERVESLEAAREGKGVNESTLRANREETARVRTAWNVLSDPFQRQRYDAQLDAPVDGDDGDNDAPGDAGDGRGAELELTGWRKLLAPPPPRPPRNGASAGGGDKAPPPGRPVLQPTIPLPPGVTLAEPRTRGMALMFDVSILLLLYIGIQFVLPNMIQSDYTDIRDEIADVAEREDNQNDRADDFFDRADTARDNGNTARAQELRAEGREARDNAEAADRQAQNLAEDIQGTTLTVTTIGLVLFLLYLVPPTAMTGRTLGMRGRKIKVLRVDGSPVGWVPSFARFIVPIALALYIPTLGPVLGLGLVLWGFRDRNRQGIHDKLAKTIVVNEPV